MIADKFKMSILERFRLILNGPRLLRFHRIGTNLGRDYLPNLLEKGGDGIIKWINFCSSLSYYTAPITIPYLYSRGAFLFDEASISGWVKFFGTVSILFIVASLFRFIGRFSNKDYLDFTSVLLDVKSFPTPQNKASLRNFDFDFYAWPVDYDLQTLSRSDKKTLPVHSEVTEYKTSFKASLMDFLGYIAIHSFGRRMVYPGTTAIIQTLMGPMLNAGRAKIIEEKLGRRAKLISYDGNQIDTVIVDRRNDSKFKNGNTLVIVCEGNGGFYELGCTGTPLDAGYSVLGWNHPGFAGSSGVPFPEAEQNAVNAVVQYATNKLGFQHSDIIMYAWSIGGYVASWAAMNYPQLKCLILDATFDDLVPLAVSRMPPSWKPLVSYTLRKYMDMRNAEQTCRYQGPILLIRRMRDEMITTSVEPNSLWSNRGNDLLVALLKYRYPNIVSGKSVAALREWLAANDEVSQVSVWSKHDVNSEQCLAMLTTYAQLNSTSFPMYIGDDFTEENKTSMLLYLASKYMINIETTHSMPLPVSSFKEPWSLIP